MTYTISPPTVRDMTSNETLTATPDTLNDIMTFDRVIYSHGDGRVTPLSAAYAPCAAYLGEDDVELDSDDWALVKGMSHQHRYRGPIMHPSEYVGGSIAATILESPGVYVAVLIEDESPSDEPGDADPVGWGVAQRDSVPNLSAMLPGSELTADTDRTYVIDHSTFVKLRLPNGSDLTAHIATSGREDGVACFDLYAADTNSHHYGMSAEQAERFVLRQSGHSANSVAVVRGLESAAHAMRTASLITAQARGVWRI